MGLTSGRGLPGQARRFSARAAGSSYVTVASGSTRAKSTGPSSAMTAVTSVSAPAHGASSTAR